MKYLRKFNTSIEKLNWSASEEYVIPNVCLTEETVDYNVPAKIMGVSIQHIDGSYYTTEQWTAEGFSNDEANGVAVLTEQTMFVIAKQNITSKVWSNDSSKVIEGVSTFSSRSDAIKDMAGYDNTLHMVSVDGAGGAAPYCRSYNFPDGKKGYLPSLGEMQIMFSYKQEVNAAMSLIGGDEIIDDVYWSSTQSSASYAWGIKGAFSTEYNTYHKGTLRPCRPFTSL